MFETGVSLFTRGMAFVRGRGRKAYQTLGFDQEASKKSPSNKTLNHEMSNQGPPTVGSTGERDSNGPEF